MTKIHEGILNRGEMRLDWRVFSENNARDKGVTVSNSLTEQSHRGTREIKGI